MSKYVVALVLLLCAAGVGYQAGSHEQIPPALFAAAMQASGQVPPTYAPATATPVPEDQPTRHWPARWAFEHAHNVWHYDRVAWRVGYAAAMWHYGGDPDGEGVPTPPAAFPGPEPTE